MPALLLREIFFAPEALCCCFVRPIFSLYELQKMQSGTRRFERFLLFGRVFSNGQVVQVPKRHR